MMAALALVVAALLVGGVIAYLVTSPTTQWIVPTVHRGRPDRARVALTFDDGPDPVYTPRVLDLLRAHGARATFFVVGSRALQHPELVARAAREGHLVASHTFSHSHAFHFQGARVMAEDIAQGIRAVAEITGNPPRFFRPPQGLRVPTLRGAFGLLADAPTCVTWTVRGLDTIASSAGPVVARVRRRLGPGAIVALHDGTGFGGGSRREATLEATRQILALARAQGLDCVTLDELLMQEPS